MIKSAFYLTIKTIFYILLATFATNSFALEPVNQNLDILNKEYYLDGAELYNTTLPIKDTYTRKITGQIKYKIPEEKYFPTQPYYQQNFSNRNQIVEPIRKESTKVLYPPQYHKQYKDKPAIDKIKRGKNSETSTAGNYIGVDFINTSLQYRENGYNFGEANAPTIKYTTNYSPPSSKNSFGFKYMYAVNYIGLFLAPEIFYEYNNILNKLQPDANSRVDTRLEKYYGYKYARIDHSYGGKINLGYDINPDFASYVFAGLSRVKISNLESVYQRQEREAVISATGEDPLKIYKKYSLVPSFGFGIKIKLTSRFYLNSEYILSHFITKTKSKKYLSYENPLINNNQRLDALDLQYNLRILKIGIMYNF